MNKAKAKQLKEIARLEKLTPGIVNGPAGKLD